MSKKDEVHDRRSHERHHKSHGERSASPPRKSSRRSPSRAMSGTRERDEDRRRSSKHERSRTRSESEGRQPLGRGAASSTSEESKVLLAISGLQKSVDSKLVDLDKKFSNFSLESTNRHNELSERVDGISERLAMVENGTGPTFGQVPPAPRSAPDAPSTPAPSTNWDRVPDQTIVKLEAKFPNNSRAKVTMAEVKLLVDTMAADLAMPLDTYKIEGKELADFFILRFGGLEHLATKQALAFVKGTKLSDGTYRDLSLVDPSGTKAQIYLNLDKNGKTRKLEGATRRLAGIIKAEYPHLGPSLYARRDEGILNCAFKVLATVTVAPECTCLAWNPKAATKHGVDMFAIKKAFLEEENIQWCS
jgi:hypothetical protein